MCIADAMKAAKNGPAQVQVQGLKLGQLRKFKETLDAGVYMIVITYCCCCCSVVLLPPANVPQPITITSKVIQSLADLFGVFLSRARNGGAVPLRRGQNIADKRRWSL